MTTLEEKLAARAGRLQQVIAAMARLADAASHDRLDRIKDELMGLAFDYGVPWLRETADLLKEQYNRRQGP